MFITERMRVMQQPDAAADPFEVRVLARQSRNRGIAASLSNMTARVKESSRGSAFTRWTSQKTSAALAMSKSAASQVSAGIEKAWARIERSPGAQSNALLP